MADSAHLVHSGFSYALLTTDNLTSRFSRLDSAADPIH